VPLKDDEVAAVVAMLKVLAGPIRLRLLQALDHQELSVRELTELVGAHYAAVSQHLARLRAAGLVTVRRSGTHMLYRGANPHVSALHEAALHLTAQLAPPESGDLAGTDPWLGVSVRKPSLGLTAPAFCDSADVPR
jgi:DNA-binding transcriptional ArsR family regulator